MSNDRTSAPLEIRDPESREQIVREMRTKVSDDLRLSAMEVLHVALNDLENHRGGVSYIPPNPKRRGHFVVDTPTGRAKLRLSESQISSLLAAGRKLTISAVPLAPQTLQRFMELSQQTNNALEGFNLRPLDYSRGPEGFNLRPLDYSRGPEGFNLRPLAYSRGPEADSIRTMVRDYPGSETYWGVQGWADRILQGNPNWFRPTADRGESTVDSDNLLISASLSLELLAQPEAVVEAVLDKLREATLALETAKGFNPAWEAARAAYLAAHIAVLDEERKATGPIVAPKSELQTAELRLDEVEQPVLVQLKRAIRAYCEAKSLAERVL